MTGEEIIEANKDRLFDAHIEYINNLPCVVGRCAAEGTELAIFWRGDFYVDVALKATSHRGVMATIERILAAPPEVKDLVVPS